MQKITLYLDVPELSQKEKERLRETIAEGLGKVWPKAGWGWLWAVGEPPTDDMAKALIAGAGKVVEGGRRTAW